MPSNVLLTDLLLGSCVDRRKTLPGYIGGVKIRDSVFKDSKF